MQFFVVGSLLYERIFGHFCFIHGLVSRLSTLSLVALLHKEACSNCLEHLGMLVLFVFVNFTMSGIIHVYNTFSLVFHPLKVFAHVA